MSWNKQEMKYLGYSGAFAFVWFIFLLPMLVKLFADKGAFINFSLFSLGLFFFLFIFLKSITTSTSFNIKASLGLITLFLSLDIFLPPYFVSSSGELLSGVILSSTSTDYIVGLFGQTLGLGGFILYLFTYIAVPIILLFFSSRLIPNFVKAI